MVVEKGYKQTEVGMIPVDWDIQPINAIATVIRGASPRPKGDKRYYGGNIPRLMVEDVTRDGKYVTPSVDFLTEEGAKRSRPCKQGTLTIVCSGTVGIPSFLKVDACIHDGFLGLTNIQKNTSSDYLYYQFVKLREVFDKSATHGGIFTNLTTAGVKEFLLPLPNNVAEQTAIATALSDMDALIAQTEKLIEKKKAIKQGVMQELLRPKEGWETKKLGDYGKTYGGITGKTKADFGKGNGQYIPFMNIMSNPIIDIDFLDKVNIKSGEAQNRAMKGDLFFNGSSETPEEVGLCSVLTKDVENLYLNSFCFGYRMNSQNDLNGLFLSYLFRSPLGRNLIFSLAQGATRYNLSKTNLLKLELPIPSKTEQDIIAKILLDLDQSITTTLNKLQKLKLQKQGMMQALLTGKIRLV